MRVRVALDSRFCRTPDGAIWSGTFHNSIWQRYRSSFDVMGSSHSDWEGRAAHDSGDRSLVVARSVLRVDSTARIGIPIQQDQQASEQQGAELCRVIASSSPS